MAMASREYIEQTSHVVRHLYLGIESVHQIWQEAEAFHNSFSDPVETDADRRNLDTFLRRGEEYFGQDFSKAVLCGAILEVACTGIRRFPQEVGEMPESCVPLFKGVANPSPYLKFCVGEERYGIPEGLIVYAGRNQYAHWDEGSELRPINMNVFMRLSYEFRTNPYIDLVFDLGHPLTEIRVHWILLEALEWRSYGDYVTGMRRVLDIA